MKNDIEEANKIMSHLTTLTAIINVLSIFTILGLLLFACTENNVSLLVYAIIIFILNIPLFILAGRADRWRGLTK